MKAKLTAKNSENRQETVEFSFECMAMGSGKHAEITFHDVKDDGGLGSFYYQKGLFGQSYLVVPIKDVSSMTITKG